MNTIAFPELVVGMFFGVCLLATVLGFRKPACACDPSRAAREVQQHLERIVRATGVAEAPPRGSRFVQRIRA